MRTIHPLQVVPRPPERLGRLRDLAHNLWWAWTPRAQEVFAALDPPLWRTLQTNPVRWLTSVPQAALDRAATDGAYLAELDAVAAEFDAYMADAGWFARTHPDADLRVAYFCAEYGITEDLPLYSGGLGVLAGDHLKSASDLGLPLTAVGLLYAEGYHRQVVAPAGRQTER
jgi:starch phosphorylase